MRTHPITKKRAFHDGIDIGAPCGQPVYALGPGTITRAGRHGGYGLQVEIVHQSGVRTSYAHLSAILVKPDQTVRKNQAIGKVGRTGRSTGCHVHLMKKVHGQPIDPIGDKTPLN